jgi:hypothetical protein
MLQTMVTGAVGMGDPRLNDFRANHKRMGWFYRLLDIGYGVELAVMEVVRLTTVPAVVAALICDALLAVLFGAIWWRYDLMSTWATLNPLAEGLAAAVPNVAPAIPGVSEGANRAAGMLIGFLLLLFDLTIRLIVTLGPSLIQFRMPYMAMNHDAAWLALWGTAVFDMATDSADIRADVPRFFGWLIEAANTANDTVWVSLLALALFLVVVRFRQWPLWVGLGAVAVACLAFGQGGNVVFWANVAFWTVFASFAAQSLFFVQAAKVILLVMRLNDLRAAATA